MAAKYARRKRDVATLVPLLDQILTDAHGDDEQLWALRQAFDDNVRLPTDALVVGEPVSVVEIDYDGNVRRGLTARCRRADGSEHVVAACDLAFPKEAGAAARHVAAYRLWLGLEPLPAARLSDARVETGSSRASVDSTLGSLADLVVLSVKTRTARCRLLGGDGVVSLRTRRLSDLVPGEVITLRPTTEWRHARIAHVCGDVEEMRLDVAALGLTPVALEAHGIWDPEQEYWGEEDEPIEEWAREIIARGPRPRFELEQILPGEDPEDPFTDPILESNELKEVGDVAGARKLLMDLCQSDLRCFDAHAILSSIATRRGPRATMKWGSASASFRSGDISMEFCRGA